jgi:Protein of unknown function (DUF3662)/FHA domain
MALERFEHRLERLVEGAFAKAFRGELQPVELGRKLTREMDLHRTVATQGLVAPNSFSILLSKEDFERIGEIGESVAQALVDGATEHAKSERYTFLGPVEVEIGWSEALSRSQFTIVPTFHERETSLAGSILLPDGTRLSIAEEPLTIGRLPECDVTIDDSNVSRRHAEIRRDGELFTLFDLASTNGTRVNGIPIHEHRLNSGDVVTIGTTSLRFESA